MSDSTHLALPFLSAGQAQKHVTHNDALSLLDGLVHLSVLSRAAVTPPSSPAEGDRYLLGVAPTGDWTGQAGNVALRLAGQWRFLVPREGWRCWIEAEDLLLVFNGTSWDMPPAAAPTYLQNLSLLGVGATADSTNRLSVSSPAALFNHAGNDMQVKLNKNAATDTASFLYQTTWSGRAELGTAGDDNFHFKVSPNGTSWKEALVIDATSGLVTAYADPTADLGLATKHYVDNVPGFSPGGSTGQVQYKTGTGFGGFTLSGDATLDTSTGALTIASSAVSNAKLANMAALTFKGNAGASPAAPQDLTVAQTLIALNVPALLQARFLIMI
jgi:hypothetical protein